MAAAQNVGLGNSIFNPNTQSQHGALTVAPTFQFGGINPLAAPSIGGTSQGFTSLDEGKNEQNPTGSLGLGIGGGSGSGGSVATSEQADAGLLGNLTSGYKPYIIAAIVAGGFILYSAVAKKRGKK